MGHPYSKPAIYNEPAQAVLSFLIVITTICVIARATSRWIQKAAIALDDCLSYLAFFMNLALLIGGLLLIPRNATSLPGLMEGNLDDQDFIFKSFIGIGVFYILAILFSKLSVLFLLRRIFTMFNTPFRIAWWINLLFLVPCWMVPVFTLLGITVANKDLRQSDISAIGTPVVALLNAVSDISVLLLPLWSIQKLKLPKKQKVALSGIFAVGLIATGVSIGRAVLLFIRRDVDWNPAYNTYIDIVMSAVECSAAFLCSSLPVLKPVIVKVHSVCSRGASRVSTTLSSRRGGNSRSKRLSLHSEQNEAYMSDSSQKGIRRVREYDVDVIPLRSDMHSGHH